MHNLGTLRHKTILVYLDQNDNGFLFLNTLTICAYSHYFPFGLIYLFVVGGACTYTFIFLSWRCHLISYNNIWILLLRIACACILAYLTCMCSVVCVCVCVCLAVRVIYNQYKTNFPMSFSYHCWLKSF